MKKYLFSIALLLCPGIVLAQSVSNEMAFKFDPTSSTTDAEKVRIHILFHCSIFNYRMHTTLSPDKPVILSPGSYTILETDATEFGFFRNNQANNLPVLMNFEKNKDYFFRISRMESVVSGIQIDELTENAFKMQMFANDVNPKPTVIRIHQSTATQ